jgi:hypothetical protein
MCIRDLQLLKNLIEIERRFMDVTGGGGADVVSTCRRLSSRRTRRKGSKKAIKKGFDSYPSLVSTLHNGRGGGSEGFCKGESNTQKRTEVGFLGSVNGRSVAFISSINICMLYRVLCCIKNQ